MEHQGDLAGHRVDGIHHVVIPGKVKLIRRPRQVKHVVCLHLQIRIDVQNPLLHHLSLIFSHSAGQGDDLPVDVRYTDRVFIDEIQCSHTASRQSFRHISTYASDPEHCHTFL